MLSEKDVKLLKQTYKIVCIHCGSLNWQPVRNYDYIKDCGSCKKRFSTYPPK